MRLEALPPARSRPVLAERVRLLQEFRPCGFWDSTALRLAGTTPRPAWSTATARCGRWPRRSASRASSTPLRTYPATPLASASTRPGSSPTTSTSSRSAGTCRGSIRGSVAAGTSAAPREFIAERLGWIFAAAAARSSSASPTTALTPCLAFYASGLRVGGRARQRRQRRGRVDLDLRGQVRRPRGPAGGVASLALARVHVRRGLSSARPDLSRGRQDDGPGRLRREPTRPGR